MFQIFRTATILFVLLTVLTGVAYPVAVTLIAQTLFPRKANGSLFVKASDQSATTPGSNWRNWRADASAAPAWTGSELVGQPFSSPKYFWGRPSATAPVGYNGLGGSGSNLAPSNPALTDAVRERIAKLREADPDNQAPVPIDLVTTSASGLDPHISEAAALYQVGRVARERKWDQYTVSKLVLGRTERPTLGILGQSRVNVLQLNLALDAVIAELATP
jgi:K+-transporting ATPase ATPase C chain